MNRRQFLTAIGVSPVARGLAAPSQALKPSSPQALETSPPEVSSSLQAARPSSARDFDYVIIGAGAAGCVLANRLSADASTRVLLLEAGAAGDNDPLITTPGQWRSLVGSKYDWGYATEAETALTNRRVAFSRGKIVGGSSAIGAMTFIRGHQFCFDRWARAGNTGWGYEDVLPYFKRSEVNEMGETAYRGGAGPLAVSLCTDPHAGHKAFLAAVAQQQFKVDARYDFNQPTPVNVAGYFQKNILDGKRQSVADAFLSPAQARPNLEVRPRCQATRLIIENRTAVGVDYLRDGTPGTARASREIILCGGVVDSPKLLMLSGIGDPAALTALGIPVVADVPGVGRNFQDHLQLAVRWSGKMELPESTVTAGMFMRSDPANYGAPPDVQLLVGSGTGTPDRFITITVALVFPRSRGEIRLRSTDPRAAPIIRANYLQQDADLKSLVQGVKLARWFGEADAYAELKGGELAPGSSATSDADVAAYARRECDTLHHGAGSCKMGPDSDPGAVVDASLRVRGVAGLRVADGSIMPEIVNAPTLAACVMIGEKAADLVRRA